MSQALVILEQRVNELEAAVKHLQEENASLQLRLVKRILCIPGAEEGFVIKEIGLPDKIEPAALMEREHLRRKYGQAAAERVHILW